MNHGRTSRPATDQASRDADAARLVRDRRCAPAVLARLAAECASRHEIARQIVLHPRVPLASARALVPHLFWRALAEVGRAPHVNPVLRRQAERLLATRVAELALGEQVALARRASRGLIDALRETGRTAVLAALLDNPRTVETDVETIARDERTPGEALRTVAEHHAWGGRRAVRLALLRNPGTPVAAALAAARDVDVEDLRRLVNDATVPRIVRVAASRELSSRPASGVAGRHPGDRRGSGRGHLDPGTV